MYLCKPTLAKFIFIYWVVKASGLCRCQADFLGMQGHAEISRVVIQTDTVTCMDRLARLCL